MKILVAAIALGLVCATGWYVWQRQGALPAPPAIEGIAEDPNVAALLTRQLSLTEQFPNNPLARRRLCLALEANGFDAPAADCYEGLLAFYDNGEHQRLATTLVRLAVTRQRIGDTDAAITALERAAVLAPDHGPVHWRLGDLLLANGDTDAAAAAFRTAIDADADDPAGTWGLARLHLQQGNFVTAAELLETQLKHAEVSPYTHYLLARAYRGAGRTTEAARQMSLASEAQPLLSDPWDEEVDEYALSFGKQLSRALEFSARGRHHEARSLLAPMIGTGAPAVPLRNALGRVEIDAGNTDAAIGHFMAALELSPDDVETRLNVAAARLSTRQFLAAVQHAEHVLASQPDNARAHQIRGHAQMQMERFEPAIESFNRAIDAGARDPMLRIWIAIMQCRQSRCEAAIPLLADAVSLYPGVLEVQLQAARLALAAGANDIAAQAVNNAARLAPDHPALTDLQGRLDGAR